MTVVDLAVADPWQTILPGVLTTNECAAFFTMPASAIGLCTSTEHRKGVTSWVLATN
jgi:hypothetical protein